MIHRQIQAAILTLTLLPAVNAIAGDEQTWLALATTESIAQDSKWLYWFDGHARSRDDANGLGVSIIRPGIGYRISSKLTLWAGYGRIVARRDGPDAQENRVWQQATYPITQVLGGKLSGRTRLEQRRIEGADNTGHRIRQFFRWSRPIGGSNWSWLIANETFIGFNETDFGQQSGYQQNRAFAGLALQVAEGKRLEVTYLNNHLDGGRGSDSTNNNISLALFF